MEFTVPKKTKSLPSSGQLLADIGALQVELIHELLDGNQLSMDCQRELIDLSQQLVEQPKGSFFAQAGKRELQIFKEALAADLQKCKQIREKFITLKDRLSVCVHKAKIS